MLMTAKTDALLIRLTPEDRARLQRTAEAHYLDASTWARQVLLRAVADAEAALPRTRATASPRPKNRPPR
jgi:hypothetical protein